MKTQEYKTQYLKDDHRLVLIHVTTGTSNYNDTPQIIFYFADEQNRVYVHHQICQSDTCNVQIKKWFVNLGFNMQDHDPMDLFVDFNTIVYRQHGRVEDTILAKALGRVYIGKVVKRIMKWVEMNDQQAKVVKKTFFDIDAIQYTFGYKQDVLVKYFREKSTKPNGSNVYDEWLGQMFKIADIEEVDYNLMGFRPSWKLKEEELFGNLGGC